MKERQGRRNEGLRAGWFAAANEILAGEGYGALKLATLCRRLGVTTGAFYHSFDSWQAFTDALLDAWLTERTDHTAQIVRTEKDPATRLRLMIGAGSELLHATEAAIRVWAGVDERVARVQREVDHRRYEVVFEAASDLVGPDRAEAYTVWALSTLVGYEMLAAEHDHSHLLWALEQVLAQAEDEASRRTD
ncbi:TetR family transcriptional regulator [Nocardioides sp. zg-536]|uniref:TetR family transcriptional regulator n=1 Tax=Nocardioides faecalis TaxID=2803858 RepID=A0A938YD66_9ACTN|nr:TetR/AcrR family transcriptional regulator [Nocardioides faecalis]MBM9461704.1 TetR family transcriptional regulator [Nocardioides faecalis]MBS4752120.1 TetR family transcriptional regulator [Nocardioides faecalis]QVI59071.1 TetR family transcriptional regulator [Nocardioides faecalis]